MTLETSEGLSVVIDPRLDDLSVPYRVNFDARKATNFFLFNGMSPERLSGFTLIISKDSTGGASPASRGAYDGRSQTQYLITDNCWHQGDKFGGRNLIAETFLHESCHAIHDDRISGLETAGKIFLRITPLTIPLLSAFLDREYLQSGLDWQTIGHYCISTLALSAIGPALDNLVYSLHPQEIRANRFAKEKMQSWSNLSIVTLVPR